MTRCTVMPRRIFSAKFGCQSSTLVPQSVESIQLLGAGTPKLPTRVDGRVIASEGVQEVVLILHGHEKANLAHRTTKPANCASRAIARMQGDARSPGPSSLITQQHAHLPTPIPPTQGVRRLPAARFAILGGKEATMGKRTQFVAWGTSPVPPLVRLLGRHRCSGLGGDRRKVAVGSRQLSRRTGRGRFRCGCRRQKLARRLTACPRPPGRAY